MVTVDVSFKWRLSTQSRRSTSARQPRPQAFLQRCLVDDLRRGEVGQRVAGEIEHRALRRRTTSPESAARQIGEVCFVGSGELRKAADLIGHDELAIRLGVPPTLLDAWIRGMASMPDRKLLQLADLLENFGRTEKG